MDLRDLALVLDGAIKEIEATGYDDTDLDTELHTALVGMRDTALALVPASQDRKDALLSELIEEVTGDGDSR